MSALADLGVLAKQTKIPFIEKMARTYLGRPRVKAWPSNVQGAGWILDRRTKIPCTPWPENQNIDSSSNLAINSIKTLKRVHMKLSTDSGWMLLLKIVPGDIIPLLGLWEKWTICSVPMMNKWSATSQLLLSLWVFDVHNLEERWPSMVGHENENMHRFPHRSFGLLELWQKWFSTKGIHMGARWSGENGWIPVYTGSRRVPSIYFSLLL